MNGFADWNEVVAFALGLPDTELSTSYGKAAVRVRARTFLFTGRESGSFGVNSPLPEKELLMETDPDTGVVVESVSGAGLRFQPGLL